MPIKKKISFPSFNFQHSTFKIIFFLLILNFQFLILNSQITNRILFIFDDSYSMYAPWNSNIKIEVAKKVMGSFLDSLKNLPNLELALRCYGHTTFIKPERNCKDTKLEIPFESANNSPICLGFIIFKTFSLFFNFS